DSNHLRVTTSSSVCSDGRGQDRRAWFYQVRRYGVITCPSQRPKWLGDSHLKVRQTTRALKSPMAALAYLASRCDPAAAKPMPQGSDQPESHAECGGRSRPLAGLGR